VGFFFFFQANGNNSTNTELIHKKTPGAQPHMLTNISVNIMTICQKPVGLRATQVKNSKLLLNQGQ
jgi:hypothetical protein